RMRRKDRSVDADGVPPARAAARGSRGSRPSQRSRPRRLALRRLRPREHARRLYRPAPSQTPRARRGTGDSNGARRRLPSRMSGLPIRRRLLLLVVLAVGMALAALILGFNLLLARNLSTDADRLARSRASAELGVVAVRHGRVVVVEAPDDLAPD